MSERECLERDKEKVTKGSKFKGNKSLSDCYHAKGGNISC